jgi:hypothetical protein
MLHRWTDCNSNSGPVAPPTPPAPLTLSPLRWRSRRLWRKQHDMRPQLLLHHQPHRCPRLRCTVPAASRRLLQLAPLFQSSSLQILSNDSTFKPPLPGYSDPLLFSFHASILLLLMVEPDLYVLFFRAVVHIMSGKITWTYHESTPRRTWRR